jgi:polysaccharide export outer membrane protein
MHTAIVASICSLFLLGHATAAWTQSAATRPPAPTGTAGTRDAAPRPSPAPAAATADYRLVAGDKLRIEVYKDPQLSQSLQVRPDGKITLPLVGDVPAAGKTSQELRDAITGSLQEYIRNPVVTVIVVETVPQQVHVMGEVKAAGPQPLTGPLSILQALAAAGGFTDFAKTRDIRVLRKTASGTTTITFDYKDAIRSSRAPLMLQAGDMVIVP